MVSDSLNMPQRVLVSIRGPMYLTAAPQQRRITSLVLFFWQGLGEARLGCGCGCAPLGLRLGKARLGKASLSRKQSRPRLGW